MTMRIFVVVCIVVILLTLGPGCNKQPASAYGNFIAANSIELVQDAADALQRNFPPAKTRLALVQETGDPFGSALMETLRASGYAVAEYAAPPIRDKYFPLVKKPDGLAFGYVLDGTELSDELRVSLHIGSETLSRMYVAQRSGEGVNYIPQGFWTRKQ